jgi:cephalosporin hydroxylase
MSLSASPDPTTLTVLREMANNRYSYRFKWMGRPIIQLPQDIIAVQEIIWRTRPDVIIETGIAHGGSLIFSASMLELLGGHGLVIGVDIDIREHNRVEVEKHPMFKRISMIEGSSIDPAIVEQVRKLGEGGKRAMVMLDSNHTHNHVLQELRLYSPMVAKDCYLVVFDTVIECLPDEIFPDRPWRRGNSPYTAVHQFLQENDRFVLDEEYPSKLMFSVAVDGYLRCVKD